MADIQQGKLHLYPLVTFQHMPPVCKEGKKEWLGAFLWHEGNVIGPVMRSSPRTGSSIAVPSKATAPYLTPSISCSKGLIGPLQFWFSPGLVGGRISSCDCCKTYNWGVVLMIRGVFRCYQDGCKVCIVSWIYSGCCWCCVLLWNQCYTFFGTLNIVYC